MFRVVNIKAAWLRGQERNRYWQTVPLSAIAWLSLTAFLAFGSVGLSTIDLGKSLRLPFWWALTRTALYGGITALFFAALLRRPKSRPLIAAGFVLLLVVLPRIDAHLPENYSLWGPNMAYIRWRLAMDGILLSLAAALGWMALVIFAGTQGVRHVRERTELELAEKLQRTLAPPRDAAPQSAAVGSIRSA